MAAPMGFLCSLSLSLITRRRLISIQNSHSFDNLRDAEIAEHFQLLHTMNWRMHTRRMLLLRHFIYAKDIRNVLVLYVKM